LLLSVSTSQPSVGSWLQSALGTLQTGAVQWPLTQLSAPPFWLQGLPQAPQLLVSVLTFVSQPLAAFPSQSAKPAAHAFGPTTHAEATHVSVTWFVLHGLLQPPQLVTFVLKSTQAAVLVPFPHSVRFDGHD
jgi:hypothetical protein